jgi:hypothetical protein
MIVEIKYRIKDERKSVRKRTMCFYVPNLGLSKLINEEWKTLTCNFRPGVVTQGRPTSTVWTLNRRINASRSTRSRGHEIKYSALGSVSGLEALSGGENFGSAGRT